MLQVGRLGLFKNKNIIAMGPIPEPKRVDFIIQSPSITDKERKELTQFIKKRKTELGQRSSTKKKPRAKQKPKD